MDIQFDMKYCLIIILIAGYQVSSSELISLGLNAEFASMLLVVLVGGFTLIGGLGATFYVSYFIIHW